MPEDQDDKGEEGDTDSKPSKPAGKGKGRGRGRGKAAGQAKGKGKGKAKSKAKAKAKAKDQDVGDVIEEADMEEPCAKHGDEKMGFPDIPKDLDKTEGAKESEVIDKGEGTTDPDGEGKVTDTKRKPRRRAAKPKEVSSGGSQCDSKKSSKDKKEEKKKDVKNKKKQTDKKKSTSETKENNGEPPAKKAKSEPATFARRPLPSSTFGIAKWHALKNAFNAQIRPKVRSGYAHQDCSHIHARVSSGLYFFHYALRLYAIVYLSLKLLIWYT